MQKRFFHFSYLSQSRPEPPLHALRDSDAFAEIEPVLINEGYSYDGLILNYPDPDPTVRMPTLGPSDLLVLTTRPPHEDDPEFDKKYIRPSGTALEKSILTVVAHYFPSHRRSLVKLSREMAAKLEKLDRGEIEFTIHHGARYRRHKMPYTTKRDQSKWQTPAKPTLTAAFLLFARLWKDGPCLLNVFGLDGPGTLIWCYLLRTRFPDLFKSPRLVMAELTADPFPRRPPTLSFTDDWEVEILLNHDLE